MPCRDSDLMQVRSMAAQACGGTMTDDQNSGAAGTSSGDQDAPGWAPPKPQPAPQPESSGPPAASDDAPLTPLQQAVVEEVTEGQRALGREMRWKRRAGLSLFEGGGVIGNSIDNAVANRAAKQVSESERQAAFLVGTLNSKPLGEELHVPAGGPPTPDEVHEAEMNPWPHHNMAETIERNRGLRSDSGGSNNDPQETSGETSLGGDSNP